MIRKRQLAAAATAANRLKRTYNSSYSVGVNVTPDDNSAEKPLDSNAKRNYVIKWLVRWFGVLSVVCATIVAFHETTSISPPISSSLKHATPIELHRTAPASFPACSFRKYPPRRFYGLHSPPSSPIAQDVSSISPASYAHWPDFLRESEYIYGQAPIVLNISSLGSMAPVMGSVDDPIEFQFRKLCVNQTEWYDPRKEQYRLPFSDGTNPSILSLNRLQGRSKENEDLDWLRYLPQDASFVATICMTNSQCSWKETPNELDQFNISTLQQPNTVRTVFLVLNSKMEVVLESTILLEVDSDWGRRIKMSGEHGGKRIIVALDDARLFVNPTTSLSSQRRLGHHELWVSYREGKGFGYDKQVLNRLHISIEKNSDKERSTLSILMKASESATICCGRNMALLSNIWTNQLQVVSWVDPVTVETVRTMEQKKQEKINSKNNDGDNYRGNMTGMRTIKRRTRRHLLYDGDNVRSSNRRMKKSHFHGTNGYMVYLSHVDEYLGIGHFHRPPGRDPNEYARFGHHYTHAFFTIKQQQRSRSASSNFFLSRLSSEFVLPSPYNRHDAEIIQFLSGLELVSNSENNQDVRDSWHGENQKLVIAYGINDCEGAVVQLDLRYVESLLLPISAGKQVVDMMGSPAAALFGAKEDGDDNDTLSRKEEP